MSREDEVARRAGPSDGPGYDNFHATVVDAIRYGTSGVQRPHAAASEALTRVRYGPRPLLGPAGDSEERLLAAIARAVERGASVELDTNEAAHLALADLRELGEPIPPRGPDDPFPELQL